MTMLRAIKSKATVVFTLLILGMLPPLADVRAQTAALTVLAPYFGSFDDGQVPIAGLLLASNGSYYGVTYFGGFGNGAIFRITPEGKYILLHCLNPSDGINPVGALVEGSDGNLYGTTNGAGAYNGGTVFSIRPDGTDFTVLHSFGNTSGGNTDGYFPNAGLVSGPGNILYGTAVEGGVGGDGTVFSITTAGVFTTLHSFTGVGADGAYPAAPLIQGPGGLYSTTSGDANHRHATVFRITTAGVLTTLYTFTPLNSSGDNADGNLPNGLVLGSDGLFYGTAYSGGTQGGGTVFSITSTGALTTLHSFDPAGGRQPESALLEDGSGIFYGTTGYSGTNNSESISGTVYKITAAGAFATLYTFDYPADTADYDPPGPEGSLVLGRNGSLYGTISRGGIPDYPGGLGDGSVFSITTAGVLTTVHEFAPSNGDGADTGYGLVVGLNGDLYGATHLGGLNGTGTIFAVTPTGGRAVLCGSQGSNGGLIQISDGNLYGTTAAGGIYGKGSVFRLGLDGSLITLHNFNGNDGENPASHLLPGPNADLYGTTSDTIFHLTLNGVLTTLYTFPPYTYDGATYSVVPNCVIMGGDGNFYGTTSAGGTNNTGTVFRLTSAGVLTTLHSFNPNTKPDAYPLGIIQATNGNLYGVTAGDLALGEYGTLFVIATDGTSFSNLQYFGPDYAPYITGAPSGNLIQGKDGNFYLTTTTGGSYTYGDILQITPGGGFSELYEFKPSENGNYPAASLVEGRSAGTFYGTTAIGGVAGNGTVYKITVSPTITSATTGSATMAESFNYQVVASNTPTSYGATGLPAGLSINAATGLISGIPTVSGAFSVTLTATNAGGSGTAPLALSVAASTGQ